MKTHAKYQWDPAPGVDGYNVYLSQDGGAFVRQNPTLITATEYLISDLAPGSYQAYTVSVKTGVESPPGVIQTFTVGMYRFWRLQMLETITPGSSFIGTGEFELRGAPGGPSLAVTLGGTASATDESREPASNAFDGEFGAGGSNGWFMEFNPPSTAFLQFEFADPQLIVEYGVASFETAGHWLRSIGSWNLQAGHDGLEWRTLDSQTIDSWEQYELKVFAL